MPPADRLLAGAFMTSGALHLLAPRRYEAIVPRWLPARRRLVHASGVAELVCAAGLLRERPWAGPASAALLVAVFPANLQMALDAGTGRHRGLADNRLVAWGRLPLQLPMVAAALRSGRRSGGADPQP